MYMLIYLMFLFASSNSFRRLIWHSDYGVGHINEVKLRRALLFPLARLPARYFIQATQPGYPSMGSCNEYWRWFRPPLGRNDEFSI